MGVHDPRDHWRAQLGSRGTVSVEPRRRAFRPDVGDHAHRLRDCRCGGAVPHLSIDEARTNHATLMVGQDLDGLSKRS